MFSKVDDIGGIIVRLQVEEGYENYKSRIKDPMEEETLIIGDNDDRVMLVFNHSARRPKRRIFEGVTTIPSLSYTEGCLIHKKRKPCDVPEHLVEHVFGSLESKLENLHLRCNSFSDFISAHYRRGTMTSYKEMRLLRGPNWREEELCFDKKYVNVCKSCNQHATKGCCSNYCASNRSKKLMVIGLERE